MYSPRKRVFLIALPLLICFCSCQYIRQNNSWSVKSPDGKLTIKLIHDWFKGSLSYTAFISNEKDTSLLIGESPMGLIFKDRTFISDLRFSSVEEKTITDEYILKSGKQLINKFSGKELTVSFKNMYNETLSIIIRAYNDGFAFRYYLPKKDTIPNIITSDLTGFSIPKGSKAWMQYYGKPAKYSPSYEKYYVETKAGETSPELQGWCFPALFEVNNNWILITEADHDGYSPAFHLNPKPPQGLYWLRLPEKKEANNIGSNFVFTTLPWKSPWRVVIISNNLNGLITSQLVNTIAEPSASQDFSWVVPGYASWSWWSNRNSCQNIDYIKPFIDVAHEMKWQYSLIDAGWNKIDSNKLEQIITYAKQRNVGLFFWYNSGGEHNTLEEGPRDCMINRERRRAEFAKLNKLGIKGIKVDFFISDKQNLIKLYLDILKDAAEFKLMVNFHGCTIPKGWSRTWPNLLTMESVKGEENYIFAQEYPERAPAHNTVLAFTRSVIGPMDYTPTAFSNNLYPHLTTNAHELALSVLFESGLVHFPDTPSAYTSEPAVKQFLQELPNGWDSTRLISGYPGKDVIIARKKNNTWYIAGINGENKRKELSLDLSFLNGQHYAATIISDGINEKSFNAQYYNSTETKKIIPVLSYGGFVAVIHI